MTMEMVEDKGTILVVDDTPTNIQVLFDVLSGSGYRVAIAKTGESALKRLQDHLPDLILLDVMMPGIDGFEICQRLKANDHTKDIPVIFMTALSESVDRVKGLKLGAVDYITKPIQHEEVLARIQVHLQLRQLNQTLEQRIAERTADLQAAIRRLERSQMQLVQSEKMSSLGQLVAGIAHEINNPVNFIYGNVWPASNYVQSLLELIETFCNEYPELTPAVQEKMDEIDLNFVREDLPQLFHSMKIGSKRIRKIVLSLRNFSRLDEAEMKPVDLHEGIDNTLLILQNRTNATYDCPGIKIIKDYGELPKVECYASQLNQVFMNLLSNAIDALEESINQGQSITPTIHIQTQVIASNNVRIRIIDNGPGIPEDHQAKLFEPFFTTKPRGKGTGLGLSISHQIIVEKHSGKFYFESSSDKGTEFNIELPVLHVSRNMVRSQKAGIVD